MHPEWTKISAFRFDNPQVVSKSFEKNKQTNAFVLLAAASERARERGPRSPSHSMEIDFSTDGEPVASFEDALPSKADGSVEVEICGVKLKISQASLLGERLWAAGLQLAKDIDQGVALRHFDHGGDEDGMKGKRVIELGAGCAGLPGIALALRHKMRVVLSEHPEVIPLLRANVAAIQTQVAALAAEGKVAPDAAEAVAAMRVVTLDWSDDALMAAIAAGESYDRRGATAIDKGFGDDQRSLLGSEFDMVVWADAGYLGDHDLLLRAAVACCGPKAFILIAESLRSEKVTEAFRRKFGANGREDGDGRVEGGGRGIGRMQLNTCNPRPRNHKVAHVNGPRVSTMLLTPLERHLKKYITTRRQRHSTAPPEHDHVCERTPSVS